MEADGPHCSGTTSSPARRSRALGRGRAAGREDGARRRAPRLARQARGLPVWRLLGAEGGTPPTSYTIGIDTVEGTADRTRRAAGYEVLKVKVGGADDLGRLQAVRGDTGARLRIDGNEGWTWRRPAS